MSQIPTGGENQHVPIENRGDRVSLLDGLRSLPPEADVGFSAGQLLSLIEEEIRTRMGLEAIEWVGTSEATAQLSLAPRTLRRRAKEWKAQMEAGERPPVRVRKKSRDKQNSDWQFARQDLLQYRRQHDKTGPETLATEPVEDMDLDGFLEVA